MGAFSLKDEWVSDGVDMQIVCDIKIYLYINPSFSLMFISLAGL